MFANGKIDTQKIIDTQKNIIVITNGKSLVKVNVSFLKFFGFDSMESFKDKYRCICDFFEYEEEKDFLQADMDGFSWIDYISNNSSLHHKVKLKDKEGNSKIFQIEADIFYKDDDEILQIVSFHDITKIELKNSELETILLNKNKELTSINKLLSDSNDIIFNYADVSKTDLKGNITYVSKMFCETIGYYESELLGSSHSMVKSLNYTKDFYKRLWTTITHNDVYNGILENKTKDGKLISFETMIKPDYDENGKKIGYIAFRKNITNERILQKLVDQQIQEIRKKDSLLHEQSKIESMGKMIENISHQWRQPLSVISTVASGLIVKFEYDMVEKEDAIKNLNMLDNSSQFLSETINNFRDFFQKVKVKKEFDIINNIQNSFCLAQMLLTESNIEVIKDIKNESIIINGYENELTQAIVNIIHNAKDILSVMDNKNRYIFISVGAIEKNLIINIYDNGGGVDEKIISNIFEPYFTTKHQSQGTGIGLYMTQEIITKHFNGNIAVSNKNFEYCDKKYCGACFEINIPIK